MIQQNNNVIDGVNLRAETKRFTYRQWKVLTECQFLKRGVGSISLIKVGKDVRQVQNLSKETFLKKTEFPDKVFMNFGLQKSQNFSTSDVIHQNR